MKDTPDALIKSFVFTTVFFALIFLASVTPAHGQVRVRDLTANERDISVLENDSRKTRRDAQTIMSEVNEDFDRLRAINDEIKTSTSAPQLDYKKISDNASEMKKRGTRLRTNLSSLPKSDKTEKPVAPANEAEMRGLLASTHESLTAFLNNPIFSDMGSLDNQLALKARRDLESVISISDVIKSGADKLGKNSNK
jgi:septal ring factor EnvC (AmiA/AmiB activator)